MEPENHKALQLLGIPDVTVRVPVLSNPAKKFHPWQFDLRGETERRIDVIVDKSTMRLIFYMTHQCAPIDTDIGHPTLLLVTTVA